MRQIGEVGPDALVTTASSYSLTSNPLTRDPGCVEGRGGRASGNCAQDQEFVPFQNVRRLSLVRNKLETGVIWCWPGTRLLLFLLRGRVREYTRSEY